MVSYEIGKRKPSQYSFQVKMNFTAANDSVLLRMSYWRPGRYEGGNFVRNVIGLNANSESGECQTLKKESNLWQVDTQKGSKLTVTYTLNASELTAGNTYADEKFMLINPVNSLIYVEGMEDVEMSVFLDLPESWDVATSMPRTDDSDRRFAVKGVQQLLDTPFMIGDEIKTFSYQDAGVTYFVHNHGDIAFDVDDMLIDFHGFTKAQRLAYGELPVKEYHFLNLLLPHRAYNGVEHEASTVITLGPASKFNERPYYKQMLGISSHELYHTWNVKDLRPSDWTPYDFTRPDYSRLGYVAEGVTTYMGDYMLWQGRAFSDAEFLEKMGEQVQKHMDNEGRFHLSLADSSIDTWIDGYGRGVPRRRVSIYTEGALLALTCDLWILSKTHGERDLNTVMRSLFEKFKGQKGFSETDYWAAMNDAADMPWDDLRKKVLDGRGHLIGFVRKALSKVGLEIDAQPSIKTWEAAWGVSFMKAGGKLKVWNVLEDSPAEKAGFWFDDEVLEIGGEKPDAFFENPERTLPDSMTVSLQSGFRTKDITVQKDGHVWIQKFTVKHLGDGDYPLFELWKTAVNKDLHSGK